MRSDKELIREIAKEKGLPVQLVANVVNSQFEFAKNTIASGEDETIWLTFLGKFRVKPYRRKMIDLMSAAAKERKNDKEQ